MFRLLLILLILGVAVEASTYILKQRIRATKTLNILSAQEARDIGLSWSDDSSPKSLTSIRLSLFSTDGDLPIESSIVSIQNGLNKFLLDELNAKYDWGSQVKQVNSKVISQSSTASSRRRNGRLLQVTGSAIETSIEVVFSHEPSPSKNNVDTNVQAIMNKDLSFLISNITDIAEGDPELENIDKIYYLGEIVESAPVAPPVLPPSADDPRSDISSGTVSANEEERKQESKQGANLLLIVPIVAASCVVIAAAALYTNMVRKTQQPLVTSSSSSLAAPSDGANSKEILHTDTGVNLFWDGESDAFSVEAALVESPRWIRNRQSRSPAGRILYRNHDEISTDQSDIFSGIDFETGTSAVTSVEESPKSGKFENRSVFSFLSGFGSRGEASTVVHSNVTKKTPTSYHEYSPSASDTFLLGHVAAAQRMNPMGDEGTTPRSRVSSLFTFSEEDTADLYSSGEEKDNTESDKPRKCLPDFNLLNAPGEQGKLDVLFDDETASCLSASAKNPMVTSSPKTETFVMGSAVQSSSPRKVIPSQAISYIHGEATDDTARSAAPINVYDIPLTNKFETVAPSPKESNCFGKPAEEFDTNKRWNQFLSSFKNETNESVTPQDHANLTPKSMIDFNDNSSVTNDDGYHTDPGPTSNYNTTSTRTNQSFKRSLGVEARQDESVQSDADNLSREETDLSTDPGASPSGRPRSRRHTKNPTGDGTNTYQNDTMGDWSVAEYTNDEASVNEPAIPKMSFKRRQDVDLTQIEVNSSQKVNSNVNVKVPPMKSPRSPAYRISPRTPKSAGTNDSTVSGLSGSLSALSEASGSKQLVSDLVWLEKKINSITTTVVASPKKENPSPAQTPKNIATVHADSLSFNSEDAASASGSGSAESDASKTNSKQLKQVIKSPKSRTTDTVHSIVCRDCYAPPGKLKIVIHSTKDGPAVHTVKKGSSLEGHVFPGDLIISVDNVDTRSYSAEQVMKMMIGKTRFERKITVLHFDEQPVQQQP
jgi:hypothetical protein